ncbi:MAG: J domain-containing protein, partial [Bradymonadaceae bacterium]
MDSRAPSRRKKELEDALHQFLRHYREDLELAEISEVLLEVSESLCEDTSPDVIVSRCEDHARVTFTYLSTRSLERDLASYLDLRGISVTSQTRLPLLSDVHIEIRLSGLGDVVKLGGRVVQHTAEGMALEVARTDEITRQRLRQMPAKLAGGDLDSGPERTHRGLPQAAANTDYVTVEGIPVVGELVLLQHEPVGRWQLEQVPLERVLLDILHHQGWGVLQVELLNSSRQIITHNGHVLDLQTDPENDDESLGRLLVTARQIDERQLEQARLYAEKHGLPLGEALVALQILSYRKLLLALKSRLAYMLEKVWNERRGLVRFFALDGPPRHYITPPLSLAARIFSHLLGRYRGMSEGDVLELCRKRYAGRLIAACEPLPLNLDWLGLTEDQQRFLALLQSHPRPVRDLITSRAKPEAKTLALLLTLDHMNLLALTQTTPEGRAKKERRDEIQSFHSRISTDDHYSVLGLHWSAYDQEVQAAYLKLMEQYQLDDTVIDHPTRNKLDAIRERI